MNITANMAGKTLEAAYTNGDMLMLRTTDGHEYRIKWVDGEPCLMGIDVRILVQLPGMLGEANI